MSQNATLFQKKSLSCQDKPASSVTFLPWARPFVLVATLFSCKTPPPAALPSDGISCIASIASTLTGTEDPSLIAGACGRTIDDLIAWLTSNIVPAQPGQALSPLQARYGRLLQKAETLKAIAK